MTARRTRHLTRQIVIAMVAGILLGVVPGVALNLFGDLNTVIMHRVEWIMRLAPYGVFALTAALAIQVLGGVDRLLDMMRTVVNVTGDCAVSCIVAKNENAFDQAVFDDPEAGSVEAATERPLSPSPA